MRVVGGRLRGRALAGPRTNAIRPTSDRLRESLFNILQHAYGLPEPGHARARPFRRHRRARHRGDLARRGARAFRRDGVEGRGLIRQNIEALGLTGVARILRRDATDLGRAGTIAPFDLVFFDPPYGKGLGEQALASAAAGGWLKPGALCVLEERADAELAIPGDFELVERREAGDSQLVFARPRPSAAVR